MPTIKLAGCVILRENKILLIKKEGRSYWELPGGVVKDLSREDTAAKITEEQICALPTIIQYFTTLEYQIDGQNIEAEIYECDLPLDSKLVPAENVVEANWFDLSKVIEENIGNDVKEILTIL